MLDGESRERWEKARADKTESEAALAKLDLHQRQRDLITQADAERIMDERLDRIAARLKAIPSKEAWRFVGLTGIPQVVPVLREVIDTVMAELSGDPDPEDAEYDPNPLPRSTT